MRKKVNPGAKHDSHIGNDSLIMMRFYNKMSYFLFKKKCLESKQQFYGVNEPRLSKESGCVCGLKTTLTHFVLNNTALSLCAIMKLWPGAVSLA